jgi:hypothetical protein
VGTTAVYDPTDARCRHYDPRGAARELFRCRDPEVLMEGPAGTGKTRAVLEKVNLALLKYPGARALIVRKSRESMTETVLVTLESHVIPPNPAAYPDTGANLRRVRQSYVYPNGSELVVGGMDKADKIMSAEYDLIGAFEATELTEDDAEKLTTRLRNGAMPYQQAIFDCNPGAPTHWLNRRAARPFAVSPDLAAYLPPARSGQTQMTRLLSRHEDNPRLFDLKAGRWTPRGATYVAKLDALTGHRRLRLRQGRWAAAEGLVYDGWDAAVHLVDALPAGWRHWRKFRAVDFGYVNPFVCQWWAVDPDGRMYLYRQLYRTRTLVEDHAARIVALSAADGRIEATVADHDAEDRATLARHGIDTVPAYKSLREGIQLVGERLRPAGDGRPRLFVVRDCLADGTDPELDAAKRPADTVAEFDGYVYPKGTDGKPLKEEPVKADDHGLDALRYAVAYVDLQGPMVVESEAAEAVG